MGWNFNLFEQFGAFYKDNDSYQDDDGKGVFERFQEAIQDEHDQNVAPLIDNMLINVIVPKTAYDRYIVYQESTKGFIPNVTLYLSPDIATRRMIVKNFKAYVKIKGTKKCYRVLFGMLGLAMTLTEYDEDSGHFDENPFDDANLTWDSGCQPCTDYSLDLTGTASLTQTLINALQSIIIFNQPINARLRSVTYNGSSLATLTPDFNSDFNDDFAI